MYDSSKPSEKYPPAARKEESFTSTVIDDKYCAYDDMKNGMWCMCVLCGLVTVKNGQPFTTGRWIEHNNSVSQNRKVEQYEHIENIKAAKSS